MITPVRTAIYSPSLPNMARWLMLPEFADRDSGRDAKGCRAGRSATGASVTSSAVRKPVRSSALHISPAWAVHCRCLLPGEQDLHRQRVLAAVIAAKDGGEQPGAQAWPDRHDQPA
jgi:hypothetical protein